MRRMARTLVAAIATDAVFGNAFDAPQDTSIGQFKASCRFPSKDISGAGLDMFLTNDVKGGIKDSIGAYFATRKSFRTIHDQAKLK